MEPRRDSVFPPQWRITHSSRQLAQVLASGLSLIAFILLVALLPGLFTDTYLWRGFPAAVVWWAAGVAVARWAADRDGVRRWVRRPLDRWLPGGRQ